ncbi:MAG: hypothetical protein IJ876_06545 [Elusimicrobiaceae bacterium]|nr:hypothetical protein [Elusimicrobiaceae bacterium]
MSKKNKIWLCVLVLTGGLLATVQTVQAASAEKQLQKGIEAYQKNNTDKALDYFVDVLMNGDNEQVATANKYIDAIHNQIGGIKTPVEVDVSFPNQPTQTIVDKTENLANYGTEKLNTLATEGETVAAETAAALGTPKTLTEQIEERQLAGYLQDGTEPLSQAQSTALDQAAVLEETAANGVAATQDDLAAIANELNQPLTIPSDPVLPTAEATALPTAATPAAALTVSETPSASSTFADLTSPSAIEARNIYTAQKLQSLTDSAIAELSADKGVHLYMRPDGRPDAIDIDDGVLFQNNSFRTQSLGTLNSIYELLALTQGARYTILPAGSYTDDVTLSGIRQAMALKSYLVKRGISQGKLYYNMGLVDQEVPAQFSNLKGLSIVFDYDTQLPTRLLENEGNETAPLLSMAIVPQCHAIDRSLGEAYAIDFSVLETVNTLDNWVLQVIQHGRDGNYYIVRQLEGFSPVYHQILWNGRKGIIGPELPCGKYTIVLTGIDLKGNKQTLRRRVIVKCAADPAPSCQMGTCKQATAVQSTGTLNYKAARLWKKPGRVMYPGNKQVAAEEMAAAVVTEQADTASSNSSSYTVTKTVRNIVTNDTTSSSGIASSSEEYAPLPADAGGYAPAANNPYDMPYEEEYTETTTY